MRRGMTLIEVLIVGVIMLIVGGGLVAIWDVTESSRERVFQTNDLVARTRNAIDLVIRRARGAQRCEQIGNGFVTNSVFASAAGNEFTYYTNDSGATCRIYLSGTELRAQVGNTITKLADDVTAVKFTYYLAEEYNGSWLADENEVEPKVDVLPSIGGIKVDLTVSRDGESRTMTAKVRLRNSPVNR
jgi:type II secretory pathway pseudopilin PulG